MFELKHDLAYHLLFKYIVILCGGKNYVKMKKNLSDIKIYCINEFNHNLWLFL